MHGLQQMRRPLPKEGNRGFPSGAECADHPSPRCSKYMTIAINTTKCTGCNRCVDLCPGDLIRLNDEKKAFICDSADCWDCMVCVKECPVQAIQTRLPFQLANKGATLVPKNLGDKIEWTLTLPDGKKEVFTIKTREI